MVFPKNPVFAYISPRADGLQTLAGRFSHRNQHCSPVTSPPSPHPVCWKFGSKEHCMFKKYALVTTGLMLAVSSVGCCMSRGYSAGYPMGGGCSPCNNGCSPAGAGYVPQGAQLYQGDMSQTAYAPAGYTQSAYVPQQTATAPAVIQGAPIYNTAVIPVNSLPTY